MTDKPLRTGSFDDILAANDNTGKPLDIPEWDVRVVVRGFRRTEALQWSAVDDPGEANAIILHYGLVEPAVTMEQARELVTVKSQVAVARIVREVMDLSGLGDTFRRGAEG